jgi:Stress responsive A/B Barrel Domain
MLTHIVFFKLTDRTPENIQKLREALLSMTGHIPQIRHMEVGVNVVPSERAFDVALYQHFDSLHDLQEYQAHPNHQDVLKYILSVTAARVSVDYES